MNPFFVAFSRQPSFSDQSSGLWSFTERVAAQTTLSLYHLSFHLVDMQIFGRQLWLLTGWPIIHTTNRSTGSKASLEFQCGADAVMSDIYSSMLTMRLPTVDSLGTDCVTNTKSRISEVLGIFYTICSATWFECKIVGDNLCGASNSKILQVQFSHVEGTLTKLLSCRTATTKNIESRDRTNCPTLRMSGLAHTSMHKADFDNRFIMSGRVVCNFGAIKSTDHRRWFPKNVRITICVVFRVQRSSIGAEVQHSTTGASLELKRGTLLMSSWK